MTSKTLVSAAVLSLLALAACQKHQPQVIDPNPDPMASALANAPAVTLPPPIEATVQFRCKDNSLLSVDFFKGEMQATAHPTKTGEPVHLTAQTAGGPYTAEGGYTLTGDTKAVTFQEPGKERSCHI